jgi:lysyl-tRNA synthetase class II
MADLVEERTGWKFSKETASGEIRDRLLDLLTEKKIGPRASASEKDWKFNRDQLALHFDRFTPAEQLQETYEKLIEPTLLDPTFVTHVPSVIIPLARKNRDDPFFADVYELAINGQEISPGYSELNDPDVQAENFRHQVGDEAEQQKTDEDFLTALQYGMPPAGGLGLGIDRLVMMLTGAESIRDVILFPLMKPQE